MPSTLTAQSADAISARLVELLQLAEWNGAAAFDEVRRFDSTEWEVAFRRTLTAHQARVAFVFLGGQSWEDQGSTQGRMALGRVVQATLLISDRVLGNADAALFGSAGNPGCWRLADLAIEVVATTLIANPGGCHAIPTNVEPIFFTDTANTSLPGRAACLVELEIRGGYLTSTLSPGPHR